MKHVMLLAALGMFCLGAGLSAGEKQATEKPQTVSAAYPTLSSGPLAQAVLADLPEGLLLKGDGIELKQDILAEKLRLAPAEVREQLAKNQFFLFEQTASERLLLLMAKKSGTTVEGVSDKEMISKYLRQTVDKVSASDAEVQAFYEENKEMCGGATLEQIKGQLAQHVTQQKQQDAIEKHINILGLLLAVAVDRKWAAEQAKLAADNAVDKARASGLPSLVDFGAHGCGPCDMMTPILADMEKKYAGKANVLFVPVRDEQILGARYGVRSIPVQVFFDKTGKEIFRHSGFFPQAECEKWLKTAGIE